jgi:hypothetical protein
VGVVNRYYAGCDCAVTLEWLMDKVKTVSTSPDILARPLHHSMLLVNEVGVSLYADLADVIALPGWRGWGIVWGIERAGTGGEEQYADD